MIRYRKALMSLLRFVSLSGYVAIFYIAYQTKFFMNHGRSINYQFVLLYIALITLFMKVYHGLKVGTQRLSAVIYSSVLAVELANLIIYLAFSLYAHRFVSAFIILWIAGAQICWSLLTSIIMHKVYFSSHKAREVVAIYAEHVDDIEMIEKMSRIHERFRIVNTVNSKAPLSEIISAIAPYESVLIGTISGDVRDYLFNYCYRNHKRINIIPSLMDIAISTSEKTQVIDSMVLLCKNREITPEQTLIKRTIDIFVSSIGLLLSSPIMLFIALCIKLEDNGPIFYSQERLTKNGRSFFVHKFRSMRVNAETGQAMMAEKKDNRITKVGKVIRYSRIDELPQLVNIFIGEMSIVGPRPERPEYYKIYTETLPEFDLRLKVKAGLTGQAQVFGRYNTSPRNKLNMDLCYIESFSILNDIRLMLMTLKIIFLKESTEGFAKDHNSNTYSAEKNI